MTKYSDSVAVVGRVLIGALFFISGLSKIAAPAATQGFIASVGLPFPVLAYATSVAVETLGVLLLVVWTPTTSSKTPRVSTATEVAYASTGKGRPTDAMKPWVAAGAEIGRASCRERV